MSLSTLSGRVGPNVLDNNNTQVFIARKYATYDALMKDLEVWKTLNSVQTTRRDCPKLKVFKF